MDLDVVVGIHSIAEIIRTKSRAITRIVATDVGLDEFCKKAKFSRTEIMNYNVELVSAHLLQEKGKMLYQELDAKFSRVPSQIFLETVPVETFDVTWMYEQIGSRLLKKILCLDQITDAHNGAAILRTAAFYGVDCILISQKGNFGLGPNFHRIASGASEHVKIVKCSSLPKVIKKLQSLKVETLAFSEHAEGDSDSPITYPLCLVMGAEDVGVSNALLRVIEKKVAFRPLGHIKSLNVSVAAAVAMEKFFNS